MNQAIIDTGAIVALIDKSEVNHQRCVDWFRQFQGRLYSTEAVLTEAMYLLNFSIKAQTVCLEFFTLGAIALYPTPVDELQLIREWMQKYQDVPMDFADATLVNLSVKLGCYAIFTLDVKDFSIYKPARNKQYSIHPLPRRIG